MTVVVDTSALAAVVFGEDDAAALKLLLAGLQVRVVPLDEDQALVAVAAWQRFRKGRHPAALNLGDCFSYALARTLGAALLFKGDDFTQTDIRRAN